MGIPVARPEREIQRAILDFLTVRGIFAWRNNSGAFRLDGQRWFRAGLKGSADILGVLPGGTFLAIEVKRPTERPTPHQVAFLAAITRLGGLAFVARHCEDVRAALETWQAARERAK